MQEYIETFARIEMKYRMTEAEMYRFISKIEDRIVPDEHWKSVVNSIYFDTPDHTLIRRSMEKPVYKEKLRLRTYGGPVSDTTQAFAEIKKKYKGCVYKRRVDGTYRELFNWLSKKGPCTGDSQIHREIDYFINRYETVNPSMQIGYKRLAYVLKEDPSIRITFDRDVIYRDHGLEKDGSAYGTRLLDPDTILMEVKVSTKAIPAWLAREISESGIMPSSISKYGTAFSKAMNPGGFFIHNTDLVSKRYNTNV